MFAAAINNSAYQELKIVRLEVGKYMFGTKKIIAKIINNKLVIRVGGGYMSVEEFIEQYGRMELMKMIAAEEGLRGSETTGAQSRSGCACGHKASLDQHGRSTELRQVEKRTDQLLATQGD